MSEHEDWWGTVDGETVRCLSEHGPMTPAELGKHLGISEDGVASLVSHLAREGKVRICVVMGGPEMAPQSLNARRAPAQPGRSSITRSGLEMAPSPSTPRRSARPGGAVARLDILPAPRRD